jgi:hypothetical protein
MRSASAAVSTSTVTEKPLGCSETLSRDVAAHKLIAHKEPSVDDLIEPIRWRVFLSGRALMWHHGDDLATKNLGVKIEGLRAMAIELQIGIVADR